MALAYAGTNDNKIIKRCLHIAVSDANDDVRRAAATGLGFLLLRYVAPPRVASQIRVASSYSESVEM